MPLDSIRAGGAFVRAHGRLAISISTRPTRSVSAAGCRKSGWLSTASCRLSDGRQDVWSVIECNCVREIGLGNKHSRSIEAMHSFPLPLELDTKLSAPRKTGRAVRQEDLDREREPLEVLREVSRLRHDAVRSLQK